MIGSIYVIKNTQNNLMYVGSTIRDLETRMKQHRKDMYKFTNFKLYKAMNEFKPDNFHINLLEEFEYNDIKQLRKQEGLYVKIMKPELNQLHQTV